MTGSRHGARGERADGPDPPRPHAAAATWLRRAPPSARAQGFIANPSILVMCRRPLTAFSEARGARPYERGCLLLADPDDPLNRAAWSESNRDALERSGGGGGALPCRSE